MRSILEKLWYEYAGSAMEHSGLTDEVKQLMVFASKHHDNLYMSLSDEQKEIFEKFDDCSAELTDINEREIFVYAFRLGARIAIEVLCHEDE